jgi:hypothetical protein
MAACAIFCFARNSRWPIVRSETRNACAISEVLIPATLRSVSTTCAFRFREGWQQVNMSSRRSSGIRLSLAYGVKSASITATSCSFAEARTARRSRSVARLRATVVNQASGCSGTPVNGHFWTASANASCADSSARSQFPPVKRIMVATTRLHPAV